jgi:hypothetical protein
VRFRRADREKYQQIAALELVLFVLRRLHQFEEHAMIKPAHFVICCTLASCTAQAAVAQMTLQVTRAPVVTADDEPWYLSGQPITYAGHFYYPAGPRIHFNP